MSDEKLPIATRRDTARGLLAALGRRRALAVLAVLTLCAGVGAALVAPWIIGLMVDDIVAGGASRPRAQVTWSLGSRVTFARSGRSSKRRSLRSSQRSSASC